MKNSHMILMILGCGLPILALFLLPFFGFSDEYVLVLAIVLMFGLHFLMMGSHNHGDSHQHGQYLDHDPNSHTPGNSIDSTAKLDKIPHKYSNSPDLSHEFSQKVQKRT